MKALRDPEGAELSHLIGACELEGSGILEIGCGDGKFTRQYAGMPKSIAGIDPEISDLAIAKKGQTVLTNHLYFIQGIGEGLPFPSYTFDIAIFASSL
jgi:ubiquinone/menaquinone biosynthesis C-methylase UbiE